LLPEATAAMPARAELRHPADSPQTLLALAREREPEMLLRLQRLVEIESPSNDKAAVDRAAEFVARWAAKIGGEVRQHRQKHFGDSLEIRFGTRRRGEAPLLLLGHLDTVWECGTLARMPWRLTKERICGPGVFDMKAGVVMALTALAIRRESGALATPVTLLLHGDEEIGSPASRQLTERIARQCRAVYVLEPAQGADGAYKTARKGVGVFRLDVDGVAAHSGLDPRRGRSAIVELAHQIDALGQAADPAREITINVGVIGGGTRSNVVAAHAWAEIDARVPRTRDQRHVERVLRGLRPRDKDCTLRLSGEWNRPPMERTPAAAALFRRAQVFASEMGFALEEASVGGGSDGNFTSALGVPTLDGMGAVGAGAHAVDEHCLRRHLVPRMALVAAMLS
jgi:glutamate carboxypeptidase